MDAETPKAVELSLPQAFLLLATNDKDGKPEVPVFALRTTTAGAILAELALLGAIELQGKHIRATDAAPRTDFLQELELIRGKSRPHTPKAWVAILEGRAEVRRIYEGMASRGIVEHVGEKHLGRFRAVRYPEKDHAPEEALLKKIQATLTGALSDPEASASKVTDAEAEAVDTAASDSAAGDSGAAEAKAPGAAAPAPAKPGAQAPDARTTALIALLQAAGLFGKLFPEADRSRANELARSYWPSRAVEDELRLIRLAEEEAATL
ncbi:GPP34 family phosphoprotein [Arthrobacter sp. CC3]|uniref:GOLPH3/VPS74 family protein n=1 Tax=Arthrobacter sp. CC3 TaxID=3029185 RepID=UPI00326690A5